MGHWEWDICILHRYWFKYNNAILFLHSPPKIKVGWQDAQPTIKIE
ncbi:MAG: hypothetical protein ACSI46_27745 [Gloeotrichia echinulata DVL01]